MLKKRLIGVVTVKNGWAVQSFGYNRYQPLGKPECLVENLDRWGTDEILVQVIDRSTNHLGPDFGLLARLGAMGLETPLIYAGGIRSVEDGVKLVQSGADRLVVDALLHDDLETVKGLGEQLGAQALIGSLPLSIEGGSLAWLDHRTRKSTALAQDVLSMMRSGAISEVLIADWQHEGITGGFEQKLIEQFPLKDVPVIAFGGISEQAQMRKLMQSTCIAAVAVGNFLSYREHAVQKYKEALAGMPVRLATYESKYSLISDV
jgi:cyclase